MIDRNYIRLAQLRHSFINLENNSVDITNIILNHGFNLNYAVPIDSPAGRQWPGYTALHFAVEYGSLTSVDLLLERGADFTIADHRGFTPLRMALEKNGWLEHNLTRRDELIDRLLMEHLISDDPTNPTCKRGISHLHIACMMNNAEVVEFFLKSGVDANQAINSDSHHFPGYTALHLAAHYRYLEVIGILLQYGADLNHKNVEGITPLHMFIECRLQICGSKFGLRQNEYWIGVDVSIESLADRVLKKDDESSLNPVDHIGFSHFHLCCTSQELKKEFDKIIKTGVDVNAATNLDSPVFPGYTPLHFAAHVDIKLVLRLLDKGADLSAKDAKGVTPLDIIIKKHSLFHIHKVLESQKLSPEDKGFFLVVLSMDNLMAFDLFLQLKKPTKNHVSFESPVWPGYTLLHIAVRFSNRFSSHAQSRDVNSISAKKSKMEIDDKMEIVERCLSQNVENITAQDANGMTPLHLAFRFCERKVVDEILSHYKAITSKSNPTDKEGLSHLHIACACARLDLVETLVLGSDADLDAPVKTGFTFALDELTCMRIEDGWTALHIAVAVEAEAVVEVLVRHGADPCRLDALGYSPLHLAFGKRMLLASLLSSAKASVANPVTREGLSHLHVACYAGHLEAVKTLLTVSSSFNQAIGPPSHSSSACTAPDAGVRIVRDLSGHFRCLAEFAGYTPLHFAAEHLDLPIISLLIDVGADVRAKSASGLTPLDMALQQQAPFLYVYCLSRAKPQSLDYNGLSRLHLACAYYELETIAELLDNGADVNARVDSDSALWPGCTPLHVLIEQNSKWPHEAVELLLKHGADVNAQNAEGLTALHLEYAKHRTRRLSRIFDANPVNNWGLSHFHLSCMAGDSAEIERFLMHGADVNAPVDYFIEPSEYAGYTPLHFAVRHGNNDLIQLLLLHNADVRAEDVNGNTPLHLAATYCPNLLTPILGGGKVDINARNASDQTVLELVLLNITSDNSSRRPTDYDLRVLFAYGSRINIISNLVNRGLLAILAESCEVTAVNALIDHMTDLTVPDENGCNAIHNIVSSPNGINPAHMIDTRELIKLIELLEERGCDFDQRDKDGRTALHYAVIFQNLAGVKALLRLGADMSVRDFFGKTPYTYSNEYSRQGPVGVFSFISQILNNEVISWAAVDFDISSVADTNFPVLREIRINYSRKRDIEAFKKKFITGNVSIHDVLKKSALIRFPRMPLEQRKAILAFLKLQSRREWVSVPWWYSILRLQGRRFKRRMQLMEYVTNALNELLGFNMPILCSECIFKNLSNVDLENLMCAANGNLFCHNS